jgi:hypothetical protein
MRPAVIFSYVPDKQDSIEHELIRTGTLVEFEIIDTRIEPTSDEAFFSFRVNDDHNSAIDWTDGDETVFEFRMLCIEDLEIVGARLEEPLSLRERQPVLALVT